jgi:heptosyltransferase-2
MEAAVLPDDVARLDAFWASIEAPGSPWPLRENYVCFNTGGAFGGAKNWPRQQFADLADRVATQLQKTVLIVCGPSEKEDARWIANAANHSAVVSLADAPLSVGLTKAAIRESRLLVTTDSGPRHFAAAFQTPVVTLFGPTHIEWSETHYELSEHLQLAIDCGPCQQRECPKKHHRCMKDLSVDTVFAAVQRQLATPTAVRKVA